jgi:hypothetical protein
MDINGLVLESRYAEYQFLIKGPLQKVWRDGYPVEEHQIIPLEFDRYLCELDLMATRQEWNEIQKEAVTGAIERQLNDPSFRDMWVHEKPRPPLPWPNYDTMKETQILMVAQATGQAREALAYELQRDGGARETVVKKLQGLIESDGDSGTVDPDAETEDLFAA